jgi:hypothetical protein
MPRISARLPHHLLVAAWAIFPALCSYYALADCPPDVNNGVWAPDTNFTVLSPLVPSAGCSRMYYCGPDQPQIYDASCRLVTTPAQSVVGACSAGGGDPSSCNACLTNAPSDPCQWHLEQR